MASELQLNAEEIEAWFGDTLEGVEEWGRKPPSPPTLGDFLYEPRREMRAREGRNRDWGVSMLPHELQRKIKALAGLKAAPVAINFEALVSDGLLLIDYGGERDGNYEPPEEEDELDAYAFRKGGKRGADRPRNHAAGVPSVNAHGCHNYYDLDPDEVLECYDYWRTDRSDYDDNDIEFDHHNCRYYEDDYCQACNRPYSESEYNREYYSAPPSPATIKRRYLPQERGASAREEQSQDWSESIPDPLARELALDLRTPGVGMPHNERERVDHMAATECYHHKDGWAWLTPDRRSGGRYGHHDIHNGGHGGGYGGYWGYSGFGYGGYGGFGYGGGYGSGRRATDVVERNRKLLDRPIYIGPVELRLVHTPYIQRYYLRNVYTDISEARSLLLVPTSYYIGPDKRLHDRDAGDVGLRVCGPILQPCQPRSTHGYSTKERKGLVHDHIKLVNGLRHAKMRLRAEKKQERRYERERRRLEEQVHRVERERRHLEEQLQRRREEQQRPRERRRLEEQQKRRWLEEEQRRRLEELGSRLTQ